VTTSFNRTREQLRSMVLRKLGVLGAATSVVSADADVVYEAIDLRLKELHKYGIVWRKVDKVPAEFSLTAGVASAHVATNDILFPIKMMVSDGSLDEPVEIIGAVEYARLEDKDIAGIPTKAVWKGSTEFAFHPVPVTGHTVKLTYEKIADDTSAGETVDVDVSMLRSIRNMVCYDIADDFGVDEAKIGRLAQEAQMAERDIRRLTVERKDYTRVPVDEWNDPPRESTYWD